MRIRLTLFCIVIIGLNQTFAQNDADALRYSMLNYGSTARSLAMGNSFGALGADFSTLAVNPAGLGIYRRSEFTVSTAFSNRVNNSDYLGQTNSDNFFKFSFSNLGFVFAPNQDRVKNGWKGLSFGIGYNRTNDFSSNSYAEGNNSQHSLLDSYVETLVNDNTFPESIPSQYPYDIDLAWQTYLVDTVMVGSDIYYYTPVPYAGTRQKRTSETHGGQGEWDFSLAGNYDNRLYLGVTLGITTVRYEEDVTWEEVDANDTIPGFKSFRYRTSLNTTGGGFNLKGGAIYRATDWLRLGVAIHTPTVYSLTDVYKADIRTDLEDGQLRTYNGPDFIPFEYYVTTPFRVIGSVGVVVSKIAALNLEYEFLDYSDARVKPVDKSFKDDFTPVNRNIKAKYGFSHNFKAGAEISLNQFKIRAGGQISTTPFDKNFQSNSDIDLSRYGFSGGIGWRGEHIYLDAAYAYNRTGSFLRPYELDNTVVGGISQEQIDNRVVLTFGYIF